MAPAAAASSLRSAAAAPSSKRPAPASVDAEPLLLHQDQAGDQEEEAARKSQQQQQLDCPRCGSSNTKFCYYNNYSTTQPRHFCRACRRYWTHGGTLRNVPVGGACRRGVAGNKRRRVVVGSTSSSGADQQHSPTSARVEDAYYPDLPAAAFPFLSDGAFLPQFDLGLGGAAPPPAPFSWPSLAAVPDLYDGLAAAWSDGPLTAGGMTGAWDNITGFELSWPPPAGN